MNLNSFLWFISWFFLINNYSYIIIYFQNVKFIEYLLDVNVENKYIKPAKYYKFNVPIKVISLTIFLEWIECVGSC